MKAEIDGGAVEGRIAVSSAAGGGSRFDAELKAERLDLDAATAFARSLAGPQAEWPDEAQLSLDIGRAISAGQELRPFDGQARLRSEDDLARSIEDRPGRRRDAGRRRQFRSRQRDRKAGAEFERGVARPDHRADRAVRAGAGVAAQCDGSMAGPGAPETDARSRQESRTQPIAPTRAPCSISMRRSSRASPPSRQRPVIAAMRGIDLDALRRSEFGIESKLSSEQGRSLLALLGLDRAIAAGDGPAQFEGSVSGRVARAVAAEGQDCREPGSMPKRRALPSHGRRSPRPASI